MVGRGKADCDLHLHLQLWLCHLLVSGPRRGPCGHWQLAAAECGLCCGHAERGLSVMGTMCHVGKAADGEWLVIVGRSQGWKDREDRE